MSLSRQTEEAIPTSTGWPLLLAGPKELAGQLGGEHGLAGDRKTEKFRCTLGHGGGLGALSAMRWAAIREGFLEEVRWGLREWSPR